MCRDGKGPGRAVARSAVGKSRRSAVSGCAFLLLGVAAVTAAEGQAPGSGEAVAPAREARPLDVHIPYTQYTLDNGLNLIVHRDPSLPVASVNVWYHVGSKNERPGRTGFAHLFEHIMFEGSAHVPEGAFDDLLESVGGVNNGSTSNDRTNYWENIPSNAVERALWLEADRMGFLLETMGREKLDLQREVVKNERRQSVENQPYGLAFETVYRTLYPEDHPYHWPVIGSMTDLSAATLEDVRAFFRTYYAPNNASVAVAGDVRPEEVRRMVERWFGGIPAGPPVPEPVVPEVTLAADRRLVLEDDVQLPRLYVAWPTRERFAADDATLEILASVLSDGKGSRLYRRLVYEEQIAQDVSAFQNGQEVAGSFWIVVTARPDVALSRVEAIVREELARLASQGVEDEERERAVNGIETDFVRALERVGGFGGKADRLNEYHFMAGSPGFVRRDLARYGAVTPTRVAEAAGRWLVDEPAVWLGVVPRGRTDLAPEESEPVAAGAEPEPEGAGGGPGTAEEDRVPEGPDGAAAPGDGEPSAAPSRPGGPGEPDRSEPPEVGPPEALELPEIQDWTLSNGLRVLLVERHALPLVAAQLQLPGGASAHPADQAGLAALTADMLDEGTTTRTALEIGEEVELLGARLASTAGYDASNVRLTILRDRLDRGLDLLADVVVHPTFPEEELERVRAERTARVLQRSDDPGALADDAFARVVYGADHPYGAPLLGTAATLPSLGREEVRAFHRDRYAPGLATLVVVGDVTREELDPLLEVAFRGWSGTGRPVPGLPPAATGHRAGPTLYLVDKPGAAQSEIRVGRVALPRADARYHRAAVANTVLGGSFTSRLNTRLREEKGYTYGAYSFFDLRREPGPFVAAAAVDTPVTDSAVVEFLGEMDRLARETVPEAELDRARNYLALRLPQRFESNTDVVGRLAELALYDLPLEFYEAYVDDVLAVGPDDVATLAREEMSTRDMVIVIAGDRTVVEEPLKALGVGPVELLPREGAPPAGGGGR